MRLAIAVAFAATPAIAEYSGHPGVTRFTEAPCAKVIEILDTLPSAPKDIDFESVLPELERITLETATVGMTWGFILGFDTAQGGLQGSDETTLIRLRKACADAPETPAADLLRSFN